MDNYIRTFVPYVVGWVVQALAMIGLTVNDDQKAFIGLAIFTAAAWAYHAIVHQLEKKWPKFSILLGSKKQPTYAKVSK